MADGIFRVVVVGSALARNQTVLPAVLRELQDLQRSLYRLLEVVTDDYPSGATVLALQACRDLGVQSQMLEAPSPKAALDREERWRYLLDQAGPTDLVVLVWHNEPLGVSNFLREVQERGIATYEIYA